VRTASTTPSRQVAGARCGLLLVCAIVIAGCEGSLSGFTEDERASAPLGQAGFALRIGDIEVTAVKLTITRRGFQHSASAPLADDGSFSALVFLPAASGYRVVLEALTSAGVLCSGAADFDVEVGRKTMVELRLHCPRTSANLGTVGIEGKLNVCPELQALTAMPQLAAIGEIVALSAVAVDHDVLSYAWTASGGSLRWAATANARLECTSAGNVLVSMSVSDGDPECTDNSGTLVVVCVDPASGAAGMQAPEPPAADPDFDAGVESE
jgi:hypothetical protein